MDKVRTIAFDSKKYDNEIEFWANINGMMRILTKAGYDVFFRYEDCGIYIIEYEYSNPELRDFNHEWIREDEKEMLWSYRNRDTEEED